MEDPRLLISAVEDVNIDKVQELLNRSNGYDVNHVPITETNQYGDSALHVAATKGNLEIVKLLLKKGADVDITSFGGRTPLMRACLHGNLDVVKELVTNGVELDKKDYQEMTGFLYSCSKGHVSVAKFLIEAETDINSRNWKGETGIVLAVQHYHYDVFRLLLRNRCDVNIPTYPRLPEMDDMPIGSTAIHYASRDGHVSMTRDILENGAKINLRNQDMCMPLTYSCKEGHYKVTEILLENQAEVNNRNNKGATALYEAVLGKHTETVGLLLKYEANPDTPTASGDTPLLRAISMNSSRAVKLLILANCDISCCERMVDKDLQREKKQVNTIRFNGESMEIVRCLIFAGIDLQLALRIFNEKYSRKNVKHNRCKPYISEKVCDLWMDMSTLKHLCRTKIRKVLGLNVHNKIDRMNLPQMIKNYVLLSDLQ